MKCRVSVFVQFSMTKCSYPPSKVVPINNSYTHTHTREFTHINVLKLSHVLSGLSFTTEKGDRKRGKQKMKSQLVTPLKKLEIISPHLEENS